MSSISWTLGNLALWQEMNSTISKHIGFKIWVMTARLQVLTPRNIDEYYLKCIEWLQDKFIDPQNVWKQKFDFAKKISSINWTLAYVVLWKEINSTISKHIGLKIWVMTACLQVLTLRNIYEYYLKCIKWLQD